MKNKKVSVSIFSTTWGHHSIGKAVEYALGRKFQTHYNLIKSEILRKPYLYLYLYFPSLNIIPYKISESEKIRKMSERYFYRFFIKTIERLIEIQKPKVVVSTYFAFNFALKELSKKYNFIFLNIVADPRTFHELEVLPNAYNFVFDENSERRCRKLGINKDKYIKSGWFVRNEFQETKSKAEARSLLGLLPNIFTISVVGGSEGTLKILKILPAFWGTEKPIQVIFICGKNKNLYNSLKSFIKLFNLKKNKNLSILVKGFIVNTEKYLQASDIVIGKAGPNLLFEAVATITPFFAISHIAGQEDGNLDIIRKYKLGFVEENPAKAIGLTRKIIENPEILEKFSKPIQRLSFYNKSSYSILEQFVEKKLEEEKIK